MDPTISRHASKYPNKQAVISYGSIESKLEESLQASRQSQSLPYANLRRILTGFQQLF